MTEHVILKGENSKGNPVKKEVCGNFEYTNILCACVWFVDTTNPCKKYHSNLDLRVLNKKLQCLLYPIEAIACVCDSPYHIYKRLQSKVVRALFKGVGHYGKLRKFVLRWIFKVCINYTKQMIALAYNFKPPLLFQKH